MLKWAKLGNHNNSNNNVNNKRSDNSGNYGGFGAMTIMLLLIKLIPLAILMIRLNNIIVLFYISIFSEDVVLIQNDTLLYNYCYYYYL